MGKTLRYKRKRGNFRRKRSIKRRFKRTINRMPYNGSFNVTIESQLLLVVRNWASGTTPQTRFVVTWGDVLSAAAQDELHLGNQTEFTNWAARFKLYRVNGVKCTFQPNRQVQSTANVAYQDYNLYSHTGVSLTGETIPGAKRYPDYKNGPFTGTVKKYVGVRKYVKRNPSAFFFAPTAQNFSDMSTYFLLNTVGYVANDEIGWVNVTWYVTFKSTF